MAHTLALAAAVACSQPAAADKRFDPLLRPAARDGRAAHSVLLGIARAGDRLVVTGEAGLVLLSDDHGKTWRQSDVPVSTTLTSVRFVSDKRGWAVGHGGIVLRSDDAGASWIRQLDGSRAARLEADAAAGTTASRMATAKRLVAEGADKPLLDVHFRDEQHGWVVGAYGLFFETADGGRTWRSRMDALPNPKGKHLYRIFASGDAVHVVGEQGAAFRSRDGGRTFAGLAMPYAGTFFDIVEAEGEQVVMGLRGNVLRSEGGAWRAVDTGAASSVTASLKLASGVLVAVDEAGRVLCSLDAGRSLKPVETGDGTPLTGIAEARDGALVVTSLRGVRRMERPAVCREPKP